MKQRDEYIADEKVHNPREINLVCNVTFYGKRKDRLGTLVFYYALWVQRCRVQRDTNLETY